MLAKLEIVSVLERKGIALIEKGALAEAVETFGLALQHDSSSYLAYAGIGIALMRQRLAAEAVPFFLKAVQLRPTSHTAWSDLCAALSGLGNWEAAIAAGKKAVVLQPDSEPSYRNLARADKGNNSIDAAIRSFSIAMSLGSDYERTMTLMAELYLRRGDIETAKNFLEKVLAKKSSSAEARTYLAEILLLRGELQRGFTEYEWRWQTESIKSKKPKLNKPPLRNEDKSNKTILVVEEGGFGDTLQFIRLVSRLKKRAHRIIVQSRPQLRRLLESVKGVDSVVQTGELPKKFDRYTTTQSLPYLCGVKTADDALYDGPYLSPPETARALWRELTAGYRQFKVGLVWAGSPQKSIHADQRVDQRRSMTLGQLMPLLDVPGIDWFSLQIGDAAAQNKGELIDLSGNIVDFADTAAFIEQLDLVIGVDTAVVHLAGALGKPVWLLSRFDGCWRWMLEREDSPWYPSLRLFRQTAPGDWQSVVARIEAELRAVVTGEHARLVPSAPRMGC